MTTRSDVCLSVRIELLDTASPPLVSDALLSMALAAATATYSQHNPREVATTTTSTASQTSIALPANTLAVRALLVDTVALPAAPDLASLRDTGPPDLSPTLFDLRPFAAPQAYPLVAGRAIQIVAHVAHTFPTDDLTALTVPDGDLDLLVLFAADRIARTLRGDLLKRGAAPTPDDNGYRARYEAALAARRRVRTRVLAAPA